MARMLLSSKILTREGAGAAVTVYVLDFDAMTFEPAANVAEAIEQKLPEVVGRSARVHSLTYGSLPAGKRLVMVEDDYTSGGIRIRSEMFIGRIVGDERGVRVEWDDKAPCLFSRGMLVIRENNEVVALRPANGHVTPP